MKVRCIDASVVLARGHVYDVTVTPNGKYHIDGVGLFLARRFEPVADEAASRHPGWEPPAEQPKVDPYEAHRDHDYNIDELTKHHDEVTGATARLHAGLAAEKVRERVKAFPHSARNPR